MIISYSLLYRFAELQYPPIQVSRRLGHARASITLDIYGHLIPSMQIEAAEMIDELIVPVALHLNKTEVNR